MSGSSARHPVLQGPSAQGVNVTPKIEEAGCLDDTLPQSVKERQFSLCESWRFSRIKEEIGQKNKEIRAAPLPEGQFFEIHSSIFKPHPC